MAEFLLGGRFKTLLTIVVLLVSTLGIDIPIHAQSLSLDFALRIGGTGLDEGVGSDLDGSGNIYSTGYFENTVDFDPGAGTSNLTSAGSTDVFITKLDSAGGFLWAGAVGGTGTDISTAIAEDGAGNTYTVGYYSGTADFDPGAGTTNRTSAGGDDLFVLKLDTNGALVWAVTLGSTGGDLVNDVALDSSGNVHLIGNFNATVDFDPGAGTTNLTSAGSNDIFHLELDSSGGFVSVQGFGGTGAESGTAIRSDASDNLYLTGHFLNTVDFDPGAGTTNLTSGGGLDCFVLKLDSNNDFVWARAVGGASLASGNGVLTDGSGNLYVTGAFAGTADLDPGAGTANETSNGGNDAFFLKLDSSGNHLWSAAVGASVFNDAGIEIAVDPSGDVCFLGFFQGTADFDPSVATFNLSSSGREPFLLALDSAGTFVNAYQFGNQGATGLVADASHNLFVTGGFSSSPDFDPGAGTTSLTSAGSNDHFIVKFDSGSSPSVASVSRATSNPSNASSVDFTVVFDEAVSGVDSGDFAVDATGLTGASVTGVSGGGTIYSVTVDTGTGDGTLSIDVADDDTIVDGVSTPLGGAGASNGGFAAGETYTIDKTVPLVSIGAPSATSATAGPVSFTITYTGANSIALTPGNVTLNTTGSATGTVGVSGSGTATRTVSISGITGDGTLGIGLASGTASDAASNLAPAAGPSTTFIVSNDPGPGSGGTISSNLSPMQRQEGAHLELNAPSGTNYQWRKDGIDLSDDAPRVVGTNAQILVIDPLQATDSGSYTVVYDDGLKTLVQSQTFPLNVLLVGAPLPAAGSIALGFLALSLFVAARRRF